ncbi:MAG: glycosyltransferase, partial [Treponema sp.]|nr:glycosyltransferase [Treponema sp.]
MLNSFQAEFLFNAFVFICVLSFILYLPRIRYYIAGLKRPKHFSNPQKNALAVIVPAKNEKGLRVLLDSLAAQTYDKDCYDTYVVVGDQDDPNIELAATYKNTFSKVVPNQTCKGEALDGILLDLLKEGKREYAAFIIVDADNIVDANFVMEMNNALVLDKQIILGKRRVKNYLYGRKYRSWAVNCNALTYTFL